jgi:SAM-dependent MidA family methyltransferase
MDWINLDWEREKWQAVNVLIVSNELLDSVKCRTSCA